MELFGALFSRMPVVVLSRTAAQNPNAQEILIDMVFRLPLTFIRKVKGEPLVFPCTSGIGGISIFNGAPQQIYSHLYSATDTFL